MAYPYTDLREYLAALEANDLLYRIARPINKDTELVPLVRLQYRGAAEHERRGFLFEQVTDGQGRKFEGSVAISTFAASRRIYAMALGVDEKDVDGVGAVWGKALRNPIDPVIVEGGPCKERIIVGEELEQTDGVDAFPHPLSTPGFDPAPFLTAGSWVTRDVEDGSYNVGIYRGMVKGPLRVGLQMDTPSQHIAIHLAKAKRAGKRLEVAIVVGAVPAVALSGVQKLPYGYSEYALAGGLIGHPLELTMCETVDIAVPTHSEIVIEGFIDPEVLEPEGPFGEASGYMGPRTSSPTVQVTCITHRRNPVVQAFISEFPPSESTMMRKIGFENVYLRFLRESCNIASVQRVGFYESASCNMVIAVQLRDPTPGQAWQALHSIAGYEPSMGKIVIALDDDIDLDDLESVLWALSYRTQPAKDMMVIGGRLPRLDPSATIGSIEAGTTASSSALLVDATRGRPYPPTSLPARHFMEGALDLWRELGLPKLTLGDPWFGTDYGGWTEENKAEAALAVVGRYLETGLKLTNAPQQESGS